MTLPKKRIENLLRFNSEGCDCQANAEQWEVHALARIALSALESRADAEPLVWVMTDDLANPDIISTPAYTSFSEAMSKTVGDLTALYTRPQPAPVVVPVVPDTLPCPVLLEPGMRFGKGVRTQTMLDALQRRAEYYAELKAMTPEQRAELDAAIKDFSAMLHGKAEPVSQPYTLPEGYALVPVEPTQEMLTASYMFAHVENTADSWKAMLAAAAPQQDATP